MIFVIKETAATSRKKRISPENRLHFHSPNIKAAAKFSKSFNARFALIYHDCVLIVQRQAKNAAHE